MSPNPSPQTRMPFLVVSCIVLTVTTTAVGFLSMSRQRERQKASTEKEQLHAMEASLFTLHTMAEMTLEHLAVASNAHRAWSLAFAHKHPDVLTNFSLFDADWNATLFDLWAPQIGSSPLQLSSFGFHAQHVDGSGTASTLSVEDFTETTSNGGSVHIHSVSTPLDSRVNGCHVHSDGSEPVCGASFVRDSVVQLPWLGPGDYIEAISIAVAGDGSSSLLVTHRSEYQIHGVPVAMRSSSTVTPWEQEMIQTFDEDVTCYIVDDRQIVVATNRVREINDSAECEATLSIPGANTTVTSCLTVPASTHHMKVIRDMFNAAYPDNSSVKIVDEPVMHYTTVNERPVLLAKQTIVSQDGLKLDAVCIDNAVPGFDTSAEDTVLSLFPASGSLLILLLLAAMELWSMRGRGTWNAPKDMSKPMAMMFTDVQSSTSLWARDAEAMSEAIEIHHETIRKMLRKHNGYEVKTIGDAFMVAFKDPRDAVRCALAIQTALLSQEWPEAIDEGYEELLQQRQNPALWHGLRVRVGLHYGKANITYDEMSKSYDYYGTLVNTAARVEAIGHGGQVLMTGAVAEAVGALADSVAMGVGRETLRGLSEPVDLVQVLPTSVHSRSFPALRLDKAALVPEPEAAKNVSSSASTRSDTSSCYEDVNLESLCDSAAATLAVSFPHAPAEILQQEVRAHVKVLAALFAVGSRAYRRATLASLADKWGVHATSGSFESSLVSLATRMTAGSLSKQQAQRAPTRVSLSVPSRQHMHSSTTITVTVPNAIQPSEHDDA